MDKKLKCILLDILDQFVQVCETYQLRYYLAYGTVLGAVRHGGMIPWDDDIDIHMPREDYERLQTLPQDIWGTDYELTSWRIKPNNQYHFLKLEDTHTTLIEQFDPTYVGGIYIDIFPIDGVPNDSEILQDQLQRVQEFQNKYFTISLKHGCDYTSLVNYVKFKIHKRRYLREGVQEKWEKLVRRSFYNAPLILDYHQPEDWHRQPMSRDILGEGKRMSFEGRNYIVPTEVELYLTQIYGNYMTPPPEDKRGGHEYLYVNLDERIDGKELDKVVRVLKRKTSFRFSLKNELSYLKQKFKTK